MANHRHIHLTSKENKDTGFGTNTTKNSPRFLNKDGTMKQRREGVAFFNKFSVFQAMLTIPLWKFITIILAFYFGFSFLFAGVYFVIGVDELQGLTGITTWQKLKEA